MKELRNTHFNLGTSQYGYNTESDYYTKTQANLKNNGPAQLKF
jgi:hypothetical protein